jgi:hypothetical protein
MGEGFQAMCDAILRVYVCPGIYTLAKQITKGRLTCRKINKQALREQLLEGRTPGLRPFQSIQVDDTELPQVGHLKYLLVMVDHLTNWVKAMPLSSATINGVVKMLLDNIIPQSGLIENIDSDNWSHFIANVIRELARTLDIGWEYNSGKVERMDQTLKKATTKLVLETRLPWIKCLPLALFRIRTATWKDIGISPYKMLHGLPYLGLP